MSNAHTITVADRERIANLMRRHAAALRAAPVANGRYLESSPRITAGTSNRDAADTLAADTERAAAALLAGDLS